MHTILKAKAAEVSAILTTTHRLSASVVGASPFLDMLMELLKELLPTLLTCFATPKEAVDSAQAGLNFFQRFRLRRFVRQHLDDAEFSARMVNPLADAIERVGAATTEADAAVLFQAA